MARSLLNAKGDKNPLGRHWYQKFLKRHPDFKIKYNRNLDQSRKDAGSPEILRDWFELYTTTLVKYGISDEDTYNMDKIGFSMGIADSSKVIIKGIKTQFNLHPGNRDWVSLIKCISSRGTVLPAYIIFQDAKVKPAWYDAMETKADTVRVSHNGWTDAEIGLHCL